MEAEARPAFYALRSGSWRDLITILHPPYTAWHLSYVCFGALAAPRLHSARLWAALAAFFLAVGLGAHALDELHGRPLCTQLSDRALLLITAVGLGGAVGIGVASLFVVSPTLLPFVLVGPFLVLAYNLELFSARFHSDFWFAAAWGAFPALTAWWANALALGGLRGGLIGVGVAAGCFYLSLAQRRLSTPARELRRRTVSLVGQQTLADGTVRELSGPAIAAPLEGALRSLSLALPTLAALLVWLRL